ncbi:ABC transporter ATPase [Flavobacterium coralii]|uniref:ABC transporter ATPase n=1 Tax=Flavobacterium coralii TaxID=2838017 RepID=UPI000C4A9326|nr:ABC transporter ATPase [Flavobacterium coralii]MBE99769.1 ABC transporter ATPase [Flavobacterium sp.]MBY8961388.1 ABC transporter ATPase [Flavobacterium coralii]|tara:strand:+ start:20012 stop:20494 length:483 start_codon:yes stop_codon:yes gene_type:complete
MYVPFETLPEDARIWIYQANRKLSDEEVAEIEQALQTFTDGWAAHGTGLESSFLVRHNRFIILAVNQEVQAASGCSIDASVHFIQELEKKYNIELLDKMNVTFRLGEHIAHKPLIEFRKMAKNKAVSPKTIVFNNLVNTVGEWQEYWEVPAGESWHSRFF